MSYPNPPYGYAPGTPGQPPGYPQPSQPGYPGGPGQPGYPQAGYPQAPGGGYPQVNPPSYPGQQGYGQGGYNPPAPPHGDGPQPPQGWYNPQGGYPQTGPQGQHGGYGGQGGYGQPPAPPGAHGHPGQPPSAAYGHSKAAPPPPPQGSVAAGRPPARPGQDLFVSKVELRVECRSLLDKDVMSKSDPCAVLYMQNAGRYEEVGRTENIKNCLDPRFSRSFVVNYYFEEVQKVMISIYDLDNTTPELSDDDFLGKVETTLGQIVSNSPFTKPLLYASGQRAGKGVITVRAEEVKEGIGSVAMTFYAKKLDKKDFLGKSDPYLEVLRMTPDGSWQMVHRTEVVKNNLNPRWRPFEIPMHTLCGGNKQQTIKFDVYDWDSDGSHDYIGGFTTTLEEMLTASKQEVSWPCINPKKKAKKKSYTNSGVVILSTCKINLTYTFLDYIFGGMEMNFTVGIDFTGSNGNPVDRQSLHYIDPQQPNEYMQAIRAVGDVCQDYDTDKLFPALGFGAKLPPQFDVVHHEFAINFNLQNPYCAGIDGVLQAYFNCIQQIRLSGPTHAAPIINHVAKFAAAAQAEERQKGAHAYFILLMMTDGVLSDMGNTKQAVVCASKLPMSLIIVGVGRAHFADMDELDGDSGVLRAPNGGVAQRDIVQFVPYRDFKQSSSVELARFVLSEVPKQVTDYYKMRGMEPKQPLS
ncbi:hypothetical protein ACOMHN_008420 [Nucella lapillus]